MGGDVRFDRGVDESTAGRSRGSYPDWLSQAGTMLTQPQTRLLRYRTLESPTTTAIVDD